MASEESGGSKCQATANEEDDLEALLDSAYEDLVKVETTRESDAAAEPAEEKATKNDDKASKFEKIDENNLDEFLSTMETEFRRLMETNSDDAAAMADIEKLTAQLQNAAQEQSSEQAPFSNPFSADAAAFMANMGTGSDSQGGADDPSAGIMGALLSQLLSPDLLYPAIAQLREKYPEWLERNKDCKDFERCSRQFEVVKRLCVVYEKQQPKSETNSENFATIVGLVQELQACGDPPTELLEHGLPSAHPTADSQQRPSDADTVGDECKVQ